MKSALILCSGGVDSVVCSHLIGKKKEYKKRYILFFNYGQKSLKKEREMSKKCSIKINAEFIEMCLKEIGKLSPSLINKLGKFKELRREELKNTKKESEKWYVPCRNLIFLSYALAFSESKYIKKKEKCDIYLGFKNEGKESYSDATRLFVEGINSISRIVCMKKFKIKAPLIDKDKEDIILLGKRIGVNFKETFSCYVGKKGHCGKCLACKLRQEGFYWAGIKDPTHYEKNFRNF